MHVTTLEPSIVIHYLESYWKGSPNRCLRWLFHLRSRKHGHGLQYFFRMGLTWLAYNCPESLCAILNHVPVYGCWSDVNVLLSTPAEMCVINLYAVNLTKDLENISKVTNVTVLDAKSRYGISLAAKWCPSQGCSIDRLTGFTRKLCDVMRVTPKELRVKYLTPLRKVLKVTETMMCAKQWTMIDYHQVPFTALRKYNAAFERHDSQRYSDYKSDQVHHELGCVGPDSVKECLKLILSWDPINEVYVDGITSNNLSENPEARDYYHGEDGNIPEWYDMSSDGSSTGSSTGVSRTASNGNITSNIDNIDSIITLGNSQKPYIIVDCSGSCAGLPMAVAASLIVAWQLDKWHVLGEERPCKTECDVNSILRTMMTRESKKGIVNVTDIREVMTHQSSVVVVVSDLTATETITGTADLPLGIQLIHWCCVKNPVRFTHIGGQHSRHLQVSGYDTHIYNNLAYHHSMVSADFYLTMIEMDPYYEILKVAPVQQTEEF